MENIIEKLNEVFCSVTSEEHNKLTSDTPFNQLGLDSLEYMNFIIKIENTFNIEFDYDDLFSDKYEKVGDFADKIISLQ